MTEEQLDQLTQTVRDLDAMIPKPESAVQITSPDDEMYTLTATQEGYLRLGVEMLKAATVTPCEKGKADWKRVYVNLSTLMAPGNEIGLDTFWMVDAIPPPPEPPLYVPPPPPSWKERLTSAFLMGLFCFLVFSLFIGIGTIVSFLWEVLHLTGR